MLEWKQWSLCPCSLPEYNFNYCVPLEDDNFVCSIRCLQVVSNPDWIAYQSRSAIHFVFCRLLRLLLLLFFIFITCWVVWFFWCASRLRVGDDLICGKESSWHTLKGETRIGARPIGEATCTNALFWLIAHSFTFIHQTNVRRRTNR